MQTIGGTRLTRVALSVVAVVGIVGGAIAGSSPAMADTPGTMTITGPTTLAPGGAFTLSVSPTLYNGGGGDFAYFCYDYNEPTDSSGGSDPGHSVVLVLEGPTNVILPAGISLVDGSGPFVQFSGPGVGDITPFDTATTPLTLDFTLPSDIPEGDYDVAGGCVSPANWSVLRSSYTDEWVDSPMSITVAKDPTPGPTPQPLPETGADTATFVGGATLAVLAVGAGVFLIALRRRARA